MEDVAGLCMPMDFPKKNPRLQDIVMDRFTCFDFFLHLLTNYIVCYFEHNIRTSSGWVSGYRIHYLCGGQRLLFIGLSLSEYESNAYIHSIMSLVNTTLVSYFGCHS